MSNDYVSVQVLLQGGSQGQYFSALAAYIGSGPNLLTPQVNEWTSGLRIVTTPSDGGQIMWTTKYIGVGTSCGGSSGNTYSGWEYIDANGTVHPFIASATTGDPALLSCGYPSVLQAGAMDGSGYWIAITNSTSAVVYDVHGNTVYPVEDTNGNIGDLLHLLVFLKDGHRRPRQTTFGPIWEMEWKSGITHRAETAPPQGRFP